jgi:hypothetical protein
MKKRILTGLIVFGFMLFIGWYSGANLFERSVDHAGWLMLSLFVAIAGFGISLRK